MKPVARFAIRVDDSKKHNLILGANFGNSDLLKPGYLYEIQEWDGELIIKEVGLSSCTADKRDNLSPLTWASTIEQIAYSATHIYTREEMKKIYTREEMKKKGEIFNEEK